MAIGIRLCPLPCGGGHSQRPDLHAEESVAVGVSEVRLEISSVIFVQIILLEPVQARDLESLQIAHYGLPAAAELLLEQISYICVIFLFCNFHFENRDVHAGESSIGSIALFQ